MIIEETMRKRERKGTIRDKGIVCNDFHLQSDNVCVGLVQGDT